MFKSSLCALSLLGLMIAPSTPAHAAGPNGGARTASAFPAPSRQETLDHIARQWAYGRKSMRARELGPGLGSLGSVPGRDGVRRILGMRIK